MATARAPTRRERLRQQTVDEIRRHALDQVTAGGPMAVSLSQIAREMGMSAPAIYRYFESRDELLQSLVAEGYADLSAAVERAERAASDSSPSERLQAAGEAYRKWARKHPRYYGMLFGVRPEGLSDDHEAIDAINRSMVVVLGLLAELAVAAKGGTGARGLDEDLVSWSERRDIDSSIPPELLRLGVLTWTRLHGLVSLELSGAFADMGIDPAPLIEREVAEIVAVTAS